jgi:4-amino-4-deoxy-L-arabinose transferase-like glycosyltransferase
MGLGGALGYVVVMTVLGLVFHRMADGQSESDFLGSYVPQARSFLDGTVAIDPYRGPLYPICVAIVYVPLRVFGAGLFEAGIVLSALSAGVFVYLAYLLLGRLFSPRTARVASVLLVANPIFARFSYSTGNDMFFAAVATLAAAVFLLPRRGRWWQWVIAGALAGLTYLTRYNGVALLVAMLVGGIGVNVRRLSWRRRAVMALVLTASFFVTITPWGLYCASNVGQFFYNRNYENIAFGFYLDTVYTDVFQKEHEGEFDSFGEVVGHDPVKFVAAIPQQLAGHLANTWSRVVGWPAGILAVIGLAFLYTRRPDRRQVTYYLFAVCFLFVLVLVFFAERFTLFLIPAFLALAAEALAHLTGFLKVKARSRRMFTIGAGALAVFYLVVSLNYNSYHIKGGAMAFRQAGEWFARTVPAEKRGKIVAARKPHFGYFAGLETAPIPVVGSYDELMAYLKERGADYLFFCIVAEKTRPQVAFLARVRRPEEAPPGLTLMLSTTAGVLYEIQK